MKRPSQQGIALVITLIMLSVITFMAITFLAVSQRERGTVSTANDQTTARLAADAGLDNAKVRLLSTMLANTNGQLFDLLVSTNYITAPGFLTGVSSVTNVNYYYPQGTPGGTNLSAADMAVNVGNLFYYPRPPVFISTNLNGAAPPDFRFYLDLNRNGQYDPSGLLPIVNSSGGYFDTNGNPYPPPIQPGNALSNSYTGDPEWIGVLQNPLMPHSPTNRFVSRYAFIAVPAGKTLDINYIHNQAATMSVANVNSDGFMRNEGVGTWEINLAAFLTDLDTNQWDTIGAPYLYQEGPFAINNSGRAFEDAFSILSYRYNGNYTNLNTVDTDFGLANGPAFVTDGIDDYSVGPELEGTSTNSLVESPALAQDHWLGSDNPNHLFTPEDLFDSGETSSNFVQSLNNISAGTNSYDRYAFYRLLGQLGTDTGPEVNKLNVNYTNAIYSYTAGGAVSNVVYNPDLATNLVRWRPIDLFTLAADRLLRMYSTNWLAEDPTNYVQTFSITNTLSITNIPVWESNRLVYTPSIHRLLQLAANICEATCSNNVYGPAGAKTNFPNVFRPLFVKTPTIIGGIPSYNVYIVGYTNIEKASDFVNPNGTTVQNFYDPRNPNDLAAFGGLTPGSATPFDMLDGVPLVIGARKGFPNFNQYDTMNIVWVTRKLEFRRAGWADSPPADATDPNNYVAYTNIMYTVGISNEICMEAWNSYSNVYPRQLQMVVSNAYSVGLLQSNINAVTGFSWSTNTSAFVNNFIPANSWLGYPQGRLQNNSNRVAQSFIVPFTNTVNFFTNILFVQNGGDNIDLPAFDGMIGFREPTLSGSASPPTTYSQFPIPRWYTAYTNKIRYILVDTDANPPFGRIIDYVSLLSQDPPIDATTNLQDLAPGANFLQPEGNGQSQVQDGDLWNTNYVATAPYPDALPYGIYNQYNVSMGQVTALSGWNSYEGLADVDNAINFFSYNINGTIPKLSTPQTGPLQALQPANKTNIFQAPFVPYRTIYQNASLQANDPLVHYTYYDLVNLWQANGTAATATTAPNPIFNTYVLNQRYQPWFMTVGWDPDYNQHGVYYKDPLITRSDDWVFPTNTLPTIGWLGRIHRGTPWQTVYMKSPDVGTNQANTNWITWTGNPNPVDALRGRPAEDWKLFDLFSTAPNANASTGQLSVNQSGFAAWSAVLSGVVVLSNNVADANLLVGQTVPTTTNLWIAPGGWAGTNSPLGQIVNGINFTRTNTALGFNGTFQHVGDVLATPQLTAQSPYLNQDISDQVQGGISDATYEWLPQQIMSLLRLGQPRFVIYSYGQTLRPAPNSIVTSGQNFGLCTNYQITAEVATRAVVRVDGAPKPGDTNSAPHLVIESFNILPPD